jgi:hypothetical protein
MERLIQILQIQDGAVEFRMNCIPGGRINERPFDFSFSSDTPAVLKVNGHTITSNFKDFAHTLTILNYQSYG